MTDWVILDELAVQQEIGNGRTGEFRDPHIWKEGDIWCMLICTGSLKNDGGSAILYETDTLEVKGDGSIDMDWKYMGPVYEMQNPPMTYGTSWELPIILPLSNEAGTITKHIFMMSPAPASIADNKIYYFIGDFDVATGKFTPDECFQNEPALLDYGSNVFTGPSAFIDPVSGEAYMFCIMQDQRNGAEEGVAGWAHCVGLTRRLWLNDEGTDVKMSPIQELEKIVKEPLIDVENVTIEVVNHELEKVQEDMLYIKAVIDSKDAKEFGIQVKTGGIRDKTVYTYDKASKTISGYTSNTGSTAPVNSVSGALELEDNKLQMEIYIDRSLVEAFFNDTKSITIRSYSDYTSQGIQFYADEEILLERLYVAPVESIY